MRISPSVLYHLGSSSTIICLIFLLSSVSLFSQIPFLPCNISFQSPLPLFFYFYPVYLGFPLSYPLSKLLYVFYLFLFVQELFFFLHFSLTLPLASLLLSPSPLSVCCLDLYASLSIFPFFLCKSKTESSPSTFSNGLLLVSVRKGTIQSFLSAATTSKTYCTSFCQKKFANVVGLE